MRRRTTADVGKAVAGIPEDIRGEVMDLVSQYRAAVEGHVRPELMRQAVDAPHRARARLQEWIAVYDSTRSPGAAVAYLTSCLQAAGSSETVASINATVAAMEAQALVLRDNVTVGGWTWDQVADWLDTNLYDAADVDLTYRQLPLPAKYTDLWGTVWNP